MDDLLFLDEQLHADGLTTPKIKAIDAIFSRLGFSPLNKQYRFYEDFGFTSSEHQDRQQSSSSDQKRSHHTLNNTLAHAYALIEVTPTANKQEVKRAYRRLISRNHPDKLIAQGLPQEMIKVANDKTQKILKAYELICQSKGW